MASIVWNTPPIQVTTQYPPHQRIMKIIFEDGCEIRSRQGKPPNRRYRHGTFDEDRCVIVENETGATHKSVSSFSMAHLIMINRAIDPLNTKANTCNGWTCCTYKVNGEWVDLPNKEQRDRLLQAETPSKSKASVPSEKDTKAKVELKKQILDARIEGHINVAVDAWFKKIQASYQELCKKNKYYNSFRLNLRNGLDRNGNPNSKTKFYKVQLMTTDRDLQDTGAYPKAVCFIGLGTAKNESDGIKGRIYKAKDLRAPYIKGGDSAIRGSVAMDEFTDASFNWLYEHTKKNALYDGVKTLRKMQNR